jgi:hypothetical protein
MADTKVFAVTIMVTAEGPITAEQLQRTLRTDGVAVTDGNYHMTKFSCYGSFLDMKSSELVVKEI